MESEDKCRRRAERHRRRYAQDAEYRQRRRQDDRKYRETHRAEIAARARERWAKDPDFRQRVLVRRRGIPQRKTQLRLLYGMSWERYLALVEQQEGACAICIKKPTESLCVDHCHVTRVSRELLCRKCNTGLGCFDDDPDRLEAAAAYVSKHRGNQ
jgi:hypothetical protein